MDTQKQETKIHMAGAGLALLLICAASLLLFSILDIEPKPGPAQALALTPARSVEIPEAVEPLRILHIMTYHSPWKWTDDQLEGFQAALKGVPAEFKILQMDLKRRSGEDWKRQIIGEARVAIETWRPDLVFTGDDDAQRYVSADYVNSDVPFVFCAVNADPETYGFAGSTNVTGVLERMHYTATLRLLKQFCPTVQKAVILSDNGQMWPPMIERMKQETAGYPDIEIVGYDVIDTFEVFKQKVLEYQTRVDAIGFFGVFEFRDGEGNHVPMEDVLRWLQANSRLPDFSFWKDRVNKGTLCGVAVSGYAQGYQAGLLARRILVDGQRPADLPMLPTETGIPLVNLETARRLGIRPDAKTLLTAEVVRAIELPEF